MNTKTFFGVAAAAVLTLAGCASASGTKPRATVTQNPDCLTSTVSRIPVTSPDCAPVGRSYSSEDIERTGASSPGEALRLLDPSITVHQH